MQLPRAYDNFICMQEVTETQSQVRTNPSVVRKFDTKIPSKKNLTLGIISILVVLAGIGTGYLLSGVKRNVPKIGTSGEIKNTQDEAGIKDVSGYETTDGVLEEGGIGGEGTYHLVRGSGPSQYAYLTSSVIDMSPFVGEKVQIWGNTISGKKAGWLLDVVKIKTVD